ncbi:copper resistance protein CopC [Streptomyces sp. NPDC013178]|uniref:copper resistance CopC/CopD family protein n=1 Tax=Streptomyces sp. NPDC013178 TaxID=3155118 RepID=UPI00340077E7
MRTGTTGRGGRRLQGLVLLGTMLVLLLFTGAGQASAHAALRSADPADGSVVKTAPRDITLTFTESVGLVDGSFRVFDPDNRRLKTGKEGHVEGRGDVVRVTLPEKLGTGTFTVAWRVVSADSHPIAGAFTFSIGKPSATKAVLPSDSVEEPATAGLFKIGRYLAYGAAAVLIGAALFVAACRPPDVRPLRGPLVAAWSVLAGSTVFLLLLRAPYETGSGPAQAFDPSGLSRTFSSRPGLALVARLALLAAAAVLLVRQRRRERLSRATLAVGAVLAVGIALTWAAAEHASAGIQVPAAMTSSVLHLLAMAAWLGGLAALLVLLHRGALPARVAARFSRLATASVAVLAVTGVYQAWRGLGSPDALTDTTYGRLLLAKLAAVAVLLLAGLSSRRWTERLVKAEERMTSEAGVRQEATAEAAGVKEGTTAGPGAKEEVTAGAGARQEVTAKAGVKQEVAVAAEARNRSPVRERVPQPVGGPSLPDEPPAEAAPPLTPAEHAHRRALRRSVLAEVAVSVVVLGLTTVLTGTLPARAEAEAATTEQAAGLPVASVTMVPFDMSTPDNPGLRGTVQITIDPARVGDNSVQAVVYGPDNGFVSIPELRVSFTLPSKDVGPLDAKLTDRGGYWSATSVNLPIPGDWEMKVTVRVSDIDQVTETKTVRVVG